MNIITLEVDIDSLDSLNRARNIIKSHIGQLNKSVIGSKHDRVKLMLDSCQNIWDTDISDLYKDIVLDKSKDFCVYAHCDPTRNIAIGKDGRTTFGATLGLSYIPFYIGQGKIDRPYDLNRNDTHRKVRQRLRLFNKDVYVTVIKDGLSELESLMMEAKLIDIYGTRSNGGILTNLNEGVKPIDRRGKYKNELMNISLIFREIFKNQPKGKH